MGTTLTIVGLAFTLLGIVLTVKFYTRARLVYQLRDLILVGQPDATPYGDVKIVFNGAAVPRVMVTQLAFWNAGNATVRRADLVESDPLSVRFEPRTVILGSRTLRASRAVNAFQLVLDPQFPSRALLTFDYLDSGDGGIFETIHTGPMREVKVSGSVRGIPKGATSWGSLSDWDRQKSAFSELWGLTIPVIGGFILYGGDRLSTFLAKRHPTAASVVSYASFAPFVLFGVLICLALLFVVGYSALVFRHRLPKTLSQTPKH